MRGVARLSRTFLPALKERPVDAVAESHALLVRAGLFRGVGSGLHAALPLGLRALRKVSAVVEEELCAAGCQQMELPQLLPASLWERTGRWEAAGDELFRLRDRRRHSFCLAPTHEEAVTSVVAADLQSHRQLPLRLFQIGRKFRDELRPRYGLVRAREFLMKDLYTFDASDDKAREAYAEVTDAYARIFARLGLDAVRVRADSGLMGGDHSEEFHAPCELGEDHLVVCGSCGYAANDEVHGAAGGPPPADCPSCDAKGALRRSKGIELAHAFLLGTRYSSALGARFTTAEGVQRDAVMGCFGVGVSRVLAATAETCRDGEGLMWPDASAPYRALVVPAGRTTAEEVVRVAEGLAAAAPATLGGELMADDREGVSFGARMKEAALVGLPWTVVVGGRWASDGLLELQRHGRAAGKLMLPHEEAVRTLVAGGT